jgi:hypothetical protein
VVIVYPALDGHNQHARLRRRCPFLLTDKVRHTMRTWRLQWTEKHGHSRHTTKLSATVNNGNMEQAAGQGGQVACLHSFCVYKSRKLSVKQLLTHRQPGCSGAEFGPGSTPTRAIPYEINPFTATAKQRTPTCRQDNQSQINGHLRRYHGDIQR